MNPSFHRTAVAVGCSIVFFYSFSVYAKTDSEINQLDTVVVTATRTAQTIDETLAPVTIITQEEIEKSGATDIVNLLRGRAGINFVNQGGAGKVSNIYMRGTNSDHILVLIDGLRIGSATNGNLPLQHISIDQIERIEIVRGPRSAIYGSNAIGGVIQIFTKTPKDDLERTASVSYGSNDTKKASAGIAGKSGSIGYQLNVSRQETDGFNANPASTYAVNKDNDSYEETSFSGKIEKEFPGNNKIGFNWFRTEGTNHYDDGSTWSAPSNDAHSDIVQQTLGLSIHQQLGENWNSLIKVGNSQDRSKAYDNNPGHFDTKRDLFSWQNTFFTDPNSQFTTGFDYQNDKVDSSTDYAEKERDEKAVFGEYQTTLFDQHDFLFALRHTDNEQFGKHNTGNVEWGYNLPKNMRATAGYGKAFKAPTFNDLYYPLDSWGYQGNKDIKPEYSKSKEIGISGKQSSIYWQFSVFQTKVDNLINWDNTIKQPINIGKAEMKGNEVELASSMDKWNWMASLSLVRAKDQETERYLQNRAQKTFRFDLDRNFGKYTFGSSIYGQSHSYGDSANTNQQRLSGFTVVDLRMDYRLDKRTILQTRINNLFDREYSTAYGYASPGREATIGVRYKF